MYGILFDGKEPKNLPCNHPAKQFKGGCHAFLVELEMEMAGLFLYMGGIWVGHGQNNKQATPVTCRREQNNRVGTTPI